MTVHLTNETGSMAAVEDDTIWLQEFVETGSQQAFTNIVKRHVDLVYAAAVRQLHDRTLADDVSQAVFILLAKKAATLRRDTCLAAWLLTCTRYACLDAAKMESRRKRHEAKAAQMAFERQESELRHPTIAGAGGGGGGVPGTFSYAEHDRELEYRWGIVKPKLDDAMSRLSDADRHAVMLKYYEKKTFREIGFVLGIKEEAARKRVSRATEKLRRMLASNGALVGEMMLPTILSVKLVQHAPEALVSRIVEATTAHVSAAGAAAGAGAGAGAGVSGTAGHTASAVGHGASAMTHELSTALARSVARRLLIAQLKFIALMTAAFVVAVVVLVLAINALFTKLDEHRKNLPQPPDRTQVREERH
jgi:RNA polymerase sigma factor (sigma-70 family)